MGRGRNVSRGGAPAAQADVVLLRGIPWGKGPGLLTELKQYGLAGNTDASAAKNVKYIVLGDDKRTLDTAEDLDRRRDLLSEIRAQARVKASKSEQPGAYRRKHDAKAFLNIYNSKEVKEISLTKARAGEIDELEKIDEDSIASPAEPGTAGGESQAERSGGRKRPGDSDIAGAVAVLPQVLQALQGIEGAMRQNANANFLRAAVQYEALRSGQSSKSALEDSVLCSFQAAYEKKEREGKEYFTSRDGKEALEKHTAALEQEIMAKQRAIEKLEQCDLEPDTKATLVHEAREKLTEATNKLETLKNTVAEKRAEYDKAADRYFGLKVDSDAALRQCVPIVGEFKSPQMHIIAKRARLDLDGLFGSYMAEHLPDPASVGRGPSPPLFDLGSAAASPVKPPVTGAADTVDEPPAPAAAPPAPAEPARAASAEPDPLEAEIQQRIAAQLQ
eukprot:TRINITY_DN24201_c0_g1_i1.p2 TRINITY_DN24201_c0_g1~~TRINITY_DN24201_c0_g1_i1.p2  ORF type:complete len:447 (+),score=146.04 TRINITY_DN24201_c0_g1_i1:52-1392(+)